MIFYRVFFWFMGVTDEDAQRPGGPWWYRDFLVDPDPRSNNRRERYEAFVRDLEPTCRGLVSVRYERGKFPGELDPMSIAPPDDNARPPFDSIQWHRHPEDPARKDQRCSSK